MFETNLVGVYTCTNEGTIVDCNPSFARIVGAALPSDLVGRSIDDFHRSPNEYREMRTMLQDAQLLQGLELTLSREQGGAVRVLESLGLIELEGTTFIQGTVVDIDDLKRAEEQVQFHAYHDILTLLPNGQLFRDRLRIATALAQRTTKNVAVMYIDIDDFRKVNDTLGHTAGDEILTALAERLTHALESSDTVARPGGDDFHVILSDVASASVAERVARKILHVIAKPIRLGDQDIFLSASIGIAMFPTDGADEESLMKSADNALFAAKHAGRNTYRLATPELNRRANERFEIEASLRQAIEREEFVLHYQPIVDAGDESIIALEALLRWQHPERGLLLPGDFITVAEETELIFALGHWVMTRACKDASEWQRRGLRNVRVAVNVSAKQFQRSSLLESVTSALAASLLTPDLLEVEVTESVAAQDPELATGILHALRERGIRVAIDDIGTGYSSLSYLKKFPVTTVKIDRTFVHTLLTDRSDAAIVTAVIDVAHSLEMEVVAEGVEHTAQVAFLRDHGCDLLQGYHFGRPMAMDHWCVSDVAPAGVSGAAENSDNA